MSICPGGYSWEILVGVCPTVLQILTRFQTKKCNFPGPFSDLAFRQKLCHHYLDLSANKKVLQIHVEFAYFSFFLTRLELKRLRRSYNPVVPSKTIPDSRPKWAKCIPVFRPKRHKNPTRWGGTYLRSLYKGVLPPGYMPGSREES